MSGTKAVYEPIRSIDSSTFTGSYQAIGTPITNPSSILKIVNNSNRLVTISTNGVDDDDILPAGAFTLYDISSDAQAVAGGANLRFPANTQFYAKGIAGGTGLVYLVTIYQGG